MKSLITFLIMFSVSVVSVGQDTFSDFYINPFNSSGSAAAGSVYVAGDTIYVLPTGIIGVSQKSIGHIIKYDLQGNVQDCIEIESNNPSLEVNLGRYGGSIIDEDEIILPFIEFNNSNVVENISSLMKVSSNGEQIWKENIQVDVNRSEIYRKTIKHLNGYTTVGYITDSLNSNSYDEFSGLVTHTDSMGNVMWYQTYDNITEIFHAEETSDGGLILGCSQYIGVGGNPGNTADACIIRTGELGNELWRHHFGGTDNESFHNPVIQCADGSYLIFSIDRGFWFEEIWNNHNGPFWVKRLIDDDNSTGYQVVSSKKWDFRPDNERWIDDVVELSNGELVFVGTNGYLVTEPPIDIGWNNGFIGKLDSNLDSLWSHFYSFSEVYGSPRHQLVDIKVMPDNGFVITGDVIHPGNHPNFPNVSQLWLLRLDEFGCLEPGCQYVGIEEIVLGLENTITVYPNPVQKGGGVHFRFTEQHAQEMPYARLETLIDVYDNQGKLVKRLEIPSTGSNVSFELQFSLSELISGIYTAHWVSATNMGLKGKLLDSVTLVIN
jgi:hypothetical protein